MLIFQNKAYILPRRFPIGSQVLPDIITLRRLSKHSQKILHVQSQVVVILCFYVVNAE